MNKLKVAVVGVGALGRHHARIFSELDSVELVAVAELDAERGRRVAEACRAQWVPDYRQLYDHVDAVTVAVPTAAHLAVASEFLVRRIPVLIEKPLALNVEQAEELVELAQRRDTLLQVGHVERFNPAAQLARTLCGQPDYIRAERFSPYAFRSTDIGVVLDVMIHDLDLVLDLVSADVRSVEALGVSILGEHEDSVQARVTFETGCIADFFASRVHPTSRRATQIWSRSGTLSVDYMSRELVHYRPSEALLYGPSPLERSRRPGADVERLKQEIFEKFIHVETPPVGSGDALTAELDSFVKCVLNDTTPVVDGRQALRAMKLAEAVLESISAHQWDGHADGAIGPFAHVVRERKLAG